MYSCLLSKLESKTLLYFFFTLLYCPDQSGESCADNNTLGSMKKQLLGKTKRKEPCCIYYPHTAIQWTLQQRFQQLLPISGKVHLDLDKFCSTQIFIFSLEVSKPKDMARPHLGSETISVSSHHPYPLAHGPLSLAPNLPQTGCSYQHKITHTGCCTNQNTMEQVKYLQKKYRKTINISQPSEQSLEG